MSNKIRSFIRALAVLMVALGVLLELHILNLDALAVYRFWIVVIAFGLLLFTSK